MLKPQGNGNTGILYYVNSTSERDELISRNRSTIWNVILRRTNGTSKSLIGSTNTNLVVVLLENSMLF